MPSKPVAPTTDHHHKAQAFTLVELLVCISIIAILIGMLLPALASARSSAQQTQCMSNMRQVMVGAQLFAQDHDGYLPGAGGLANGRPQTVDQQASWFFALEDVLSMPLETIARCPADDSPLWDQPDANNGLPRVVSYATNFYLTGNLNGFQQYQRIDSLHAPSNTVFSAELSEAGSYATSDHFHPELWLTNPVARATEQLELFQHKGLSQWSYLDGHVAPDPFNQVYQVDPSSTLGNVRYTHNRFNPVALR